MRSRTIALLLCTACSTPTGPSTPALSGEWGGQWIRIVASSRSVQVFTPCYRLEFPAIPSTVPVEATVRGTIAAHSWSPYVGLNAELSLAGDGEQLTARLRLQQPPDGTWGVLLNPLTAIRNAPPDYSGASCLV